MKKKNREEQQKAAQNQPVKTGSSEKAINENEIDFPPELADFLGENLRGLLEQLGLKSEDPNNDTAFKEYFDKLFHNCDVKKLLHELKCDKAFGLQEDYDGEFYQSVDEEDDVPTPDDYTDEEIANMDFSDLDKDEYGNTLLSTIVLECPEEPKGYITFIFPALPGDKAAEECHLVIHVNVPFVDSFSAAELDNAAAKYKDIKPMPRVLTQDGKMYYLVAEETYQAFLDASKECGVKMDSPKEVETTEDYKKMVQEIVANGKPVAGFDSSVRADGYYEDLCEYWYGGKIYHEKDVIWFELPKMKSGERMQWFLANLDHYGELYTASDVKKAKKIKVENGRRVLSNEEKFEIMYNHQNIEFFEQLLPAEEVWYLASEYAKTKDEAGHCIVCRNGKFNVPVETFFNYETFEFDELIVLFNALPCFMTHHKCSSLVVADIGNMQIKTAVRYLNGRVFDWDKRIKQEMAAYQRRNIDFDPYTDPYDDPNNSQLEDDDDDEDE